ncbi:MAG: SusC/RagA family TonB-linked outer membrane protein [Longimicrobiaceae bacterium]
MKTLKAVALGFVQLLLIPALAVAQERGTVAGQVVAEDTGEPLGGAQIVIEGTNLGTLSDREGEFEIDNVPLGAQTVRVSYIGYRTFSADVTVGTQPVQVNAALVIDPLRLDEIVAVGYGETRRANVAGAISSLEAEEIEDLPTASVDQALQGRVPGVEVIQNSGNPGSAISVRVRGSSSISAGNEPLYVIDGVPVTTGNFSEINATFGGQDISALSDLSPSNIASIDVLKDASAAAIYGSRASNGVVLIETKRGLVGGRPEITFETYYGSQEAWNRVEYLDTDEYFDVYNESIANDFGISDYFGYTDDGVDNVVEVEPGSYTDWMDQVLRTAPVASTTASVRGGVGDVAYFVSGETFREEGIVKSFGYERLSGRVNLDYTASDRLDLGTSVYVAEGRTDRARSDNTIVGPFANANAIPPWQTVFDENGDYTETLYINPVGLAEEYEAEERSIRILGNTFASFALSDWLDLRGSLGLDQYTLRSFLYDSPVLGFAAATSGAGEVGNSYATKVTYEGTLNFARDFGAPHQLSGVLGTSYEDNVTESNSVEGSQFPNEFFRYLTSAATISDGTSFRTEWSLLSYFGRLSYTFDDRYTATFNLRTDGSSRFGENNRFGTFPSASLLWRVSQEPFMQKQGLFNDLRLRVSYGRTGNQADIGNFDARGLFEGGFNYDDQPGTAPTQLANPDLRWETTDQFNLGTDFSVLSNRLSFSADYYVKKTDDLLVDRPVPRTTGFDFITSNVGSMENRGVELAVTADIIRSGASGFNWTSNLNLARNDNEITSLLNDEPIPAGFASRIEVGEELGAFYGYVTDGIFQNPAEVDAHAFQAGGTAPGDIRFKDLNGDGIINDEDRAIIGSPWPDFTGGWTNTMSFRGVDLMLFAQFSQGNDIYNAMRLYTESYGRFFDTHTKNALERWTPENPSNTEPRATFLDPNNNDRDSDRYIEDGSYVRLKNAVLGYTFPTDLAALVGLQSLRVYLQGENLLTFTDYGNWDPEVNFSGNTSVTRGTDFYTLPQPRTVTVGARLGL